MYVVIKLPENRQFWCPTFYKMEARKFWMTSNMAHSETCCKVWGCRSKKERMPAKYDGLPCIRMDCHSNKVSLHRHAVSRPAADTVNGVWQWSRDAFLLSSFRPHAAKRCPLNGGDMITPVRGMGEVLCQTILMDMYGKFACRNLLNDLLLFSETNSTVKHNMHLSLIHIWRCRRRG